VTFGGGAGQEPVTVAGGFSLKSADRISTVNKSVRILKSNVPLLDSSYLNTPVLALLSNEIGALDLSNSRIDQLELTANTINRVVDLSNTRVKESRLQSFARGQLKLDGSNVRPN